MTAAALPVAVHGFTWSAALLALLNVLAGGALVAWIRNRGGWKQTEVQADEKLRADLLQRVDKLERKLEEKDAQHEADVAILRHRLNNVTQCFDALVLMIEAAPERAAEALSKIKDMRAKQIVAEAQEKATVAGAKIAAAHGGTA